MTYRLLEAFQQLFEGVRYRHRVSTNGDVVARCLYEDLLVLGKSQALHDRITQRQLVVNVQNRRRGIRARRGDGTLGERVPGVSAVVVPGFAVAHGEIANVEIGVEVKILAKAMIKQLGRVENDLRDQVKQFQTHANNPVCVGIVGINHAERYVGYEGERANTTDGTGKYRHPIQEAEQAERRIYDALSTRFDELLFMRYRATNEPPYPFEWVDHVNTRIDYGAALVRISNAYDIRFA